MSTQTKKEKTSIKYAKFRRHLLDEFDHFDKQTLHELRDDILSLERAKAGLASALVYQSMLMVNDSDLVNNIAIGDRFFTVEVSTYLYNDTGMRHVADEFARTVLCEDFNSIRLVSKHPYKSQSFVYKFELI